MGTLAMGVRRIKLEFAQSFRMNVKSITCMNLEVFLNTGSLILHVMIGKVSCVRDVQPTRSAT